MATVQTMSWKPRVRRYLDQSACGYSYIAFVYKGKIERRVDDNVKMFRQAAWDDAFAAAIKLNKNE